MNNRKNNPGMKVTLADIISEAYRQISTTKPGHTPKGIRRAKDEDSGKDRREPEKASRSLA